MFVAIINRIVLANVYTAVGTLSSVAHVAKLYLAIIIIKHRWQPALIMEALLTAVGSILRKILLTYQKILFFTKFLCYKNLALYGSTIVVRSHFSIINSGIVVRICLYFYRYECRMLTSLPLIIDVHSIVEASLSKPHSNMENDIVFCAQRTLAKNRFATYYCSLV